VFMCVGNINRFNKNIQDFKKMGYFWKYLPFELFLIFVGLLNLSGLPFSLGFFIKHFLFVALNSSSSLFYFIFVNCIFGAITGLFYSFRLYYNIFFDYKKARLHVYKHSYVFNLNSFFYSNSSLATNLCISFIFFISYIISSYLIYIYSSSFYIFNDFFFFTFLNSYFLNFYPLDFFLENFSYVNYFTLFFISIILYVFWRSVTISNLYFLWYYFFVFCFFMFFLI
jgi:NADH:ubiquinone oxidoreductase subunit 5 (subunit L)/multisubunit Na+/H+ antiporter MnhA subunit